MLGRLLEILANSGPRPVSGTDIGELFAVNTDAVHNRCHLGEYFTSSFVALAIANNAFIDLRIVVGAKQMHACWLHSFGGNFRSSLFTDPTFSANGAALSAVNNNRTSTKIADAIVTSQPTVTITGALLFDGYTAGAGGNGTGASFTLLRDSEWILAPVTTYLLRLQNLSGSNGAGSVLFAWYEP